MDKVYGTRIVRVFLLLAGVMLVSLFAFAQGPGRPTTPRDIAGEWRMENIEQDTSTQPSVADYTGVPFNEAGRLRSDTTPESIWGTPEYQCRPHSAPHQWRGLGGARILKEQDPFMREVQTYHVQFMRSLDWPIFMDGRPHPPPWAPHTWSGFSTGEWIGNTLKVTTTHLKDGYLRRGGPQTSDMYEMTDYITRLGNILNIVTVIDDPLYMEEPYVRSTTYMYDPTASVSFEVCNGMSFAEMGGTNRHFVPHFLPGHNNAWTEWMHDWLPEEAVRGGVKTVYPEYQLTLNGSLNPGDLRVPSSRSAFSVDERIAAQSPRDGEVHVMPVQGNIYMLVADGNNITVSIGPEGVLLVNAGPAHMADKILAAINELSQRIVSTPATNNCFGNYCPGTWGWSSPYVHTVISSPAPAKPIRYIVNTSAAPEHTGGNEQIARAGFFPRVGIGGATDVGTGRGASIIAHENVMIRMSAPAGQQAPTAPGAWPTDTYFDEFLKLPAYFNGEGVILYHQPAANTDGESIVHFRRSEVISAGNLFSTVSYPVIDLEKGGSVQGVIDGLNQIIDLAFAEYRSQGGTWIVPGRGRLSDTADVAAYRNMLVMVRDRVQELKDNGMTLEQVKAARPTLDFDGRYGSTTGPWTTDMFLEAVYQSLPR